MVAATTAKKLNVYRKPEDRSPTFIIRDMMKIESDAIAQKRDESTPIKITLQNNQDAAYTGKLSLGGNKEEHTFFFDTGSPWLWVALDDCTSCNWPGVNPYTPDSSTNKPSSKVGNATYVDGQFATGNIATDEVRITADSEPITMNIIGVSEAHDIGNIPADGILGLAPSPAKNTDLFVTQLHKQGLIPDDMFGLEIKPNGQDSFITLGGYDTERVPDPKEIKWINLYNKDSWWTEFRHVYYGDTILSSKGGLVVFDSGTSITTMSENILYAIINGFYTKTEGQSCTIKQFQGLDLWHCPCIGNFDDIGISMNGYMAFLNSDLIIKDAGQGE
mmetsp:Transcript_777/g.760  ORF Transcript_777/g.760 Transcript_777/m.760 type:complete len:332 (+) Transcript_777:60-1055(+)